MNGLFDTQKFFFVGMHSKHFFFFASVLTTAGLTLTKSSIFVSSPLLSSLLWAICPLCMHNSSVPAGTPSFFFFFSKLLPQKKKILKDLMNRCTHRGMSHRPRVDVLFHSTCGVSRQLSTSFHCLSSVRCWYLVGGKPHLTIHGSSQPYLCDL